MMSTTFRHDTHAAHITMAQKILWVKTEVCRTEPLQGETRDLFQVYVPFCIWFTLKMGQAFSWNTLLSTCNSFGRQQPVLSWFCMMCSKRTMHMRTQHCRARHGCDGRGAIQMEHTDFCLKCDYSRYSRCTSKETPAAIGEHIYLEHWAIVAAGQVCSAKKMQGKQLPAQCYHPQVQPLHWARLLHQHKS